MSNPGCLTWVLQDQRRRWQQQDRIRVEAYLDQHPSLRDFPEAVLDLIYHEIVLREESGDPPRLEEYLRRFPQYAAPLCLQFQVHEAIEANPLTQIDSDWIQSRKTPERGSRLKVAAVPAHIPGYEILEELGRGGMGVVYRARQLGLSRQVALKMILAGFHANPLVVARFRTEAVAVARLHHLNIVEIHAFGEHGGLPYFAMELVTGRSLQERLNGQPAPPRQAARLVETLARAMQHAHEHGILHRDLKPSNVLLDGGSEASLEQATPKISDFGLAKLLDATAGHTPAGGCVGTPAYMAPEQAAGDGASAAWTTDVYSLGAILYELLTGRPPFQGNTIFDILEQARLQPPVSPSRFQSGIPRDLEVICLKCLRKDPAQRYATALELADDLRRFQAGESIRARPPGAAEQVWKWARRRPAVAALVGLCLAVGGGILAAIPGYYRLAEEAAHRQADQSYREFFRASGSALYRGQGLETLSLVPPFSTESGAAERQACTDAARAALALVGLDAESQTSPVLDPLLSAAQQAEITEGCYALLLLLAEAVSQQPLPGQTATDRYQQALRILDRALWLGPPTQAYCLRRAEYLMQLGDPLGASAERARAIRLPPSQPLDYFLLGYQAYLTGDRAKARSDLDQALNLRPDHFWARYYLALCHLQTGNWEAAKVCLTTCLGQQSELIWLFLLRGFAYQQSGNLAAAEADFDKAATLGLTADGRYCLCINHGLLRWRQGRTEEALRDLDEAIVLAPSQYHAHLSLARIYQQQKGFAASTVQFNQALRLHPPPAVQAECHAERSRNFYLAGKYADAEAACGQALALAPSQVVVHAIRGLAFLELKRYELAVESFDRYVNGGGPAVADVYRGRGNAHMRLGEYARARDDYTEGLKLKPDWDLYNHRGWASCFGDGRDWASALSDFDHAVQAKPPTADPYVGRGLALVMLGKYREALDQVDEALRRSPETPEMKHNVACIFAQASGLAEKDVQQPQHLALAAQYGKRALEMIHQTLAMLPLGERRAFWRDKVLPDTALDPIRQFPGFVQIRKEYEAQGTIP
jgi:tetratricopeptide (TPR) repeat protein